MTALQAAVGRLVAVAELLPEEQQMAVVAAARHHTCAQCGGEGHNRRTCGRAPPAKVSPQERANAERREADLELLRLVGAKGRAGAAAELQVSRQALHERLHGALRRQGATAPAELLEAVRAQEEAPRKAPQQPVPEPAPRVELVTWAVSMTDAEYERLRGLAGRTLDDTPIPRGALAAAVAGLAERCSSEWPALPESLAPWGTGTIKVPLRISALALAHLRAVAATRGTTAGLLFRAALATTP